MKEEKDNIKIELRSEEFQEILGDVPSWILRRGITIIGIIILVVLIGSAIFKYPDTISTTMTLTGATPAASLISRTSGKIQELNIKDKQQVKAQTYLAVIENPANTNDIIALKEYLRFVNRNTDSIVNMPPKDLNLGNIQSLYSNFYITLFEYIEFQRLRYYIKKIDFMQEKINRYQNYNNSIIKQKDIIYEQFKLSQNQYKRDSLLNRKGVISVEELELSKNQHLQSYLSLENMHSEIKNTEIQITQMKENLLDIEYQYSDKKNTLESQLKTYTSQLISEIQAWEQAYTLISPIDGQVSFTNYWTENQNVVLGETVFTIIPNGNEQLIGKAQMPQVRSGKVKIGHRVNIRFSNFPDNEYGIVRGFVKNISMVPTKNIEGVNSNYYVVEIELPDKLMTSYNKELPYLPEMEAQADIITEDLSLLERFFMPVRKILTENI